MKIIIDYEASWRNSFLDGSNEEPLPKKGRKFVASKKQLRENKKNYIDREITKNTVMGILSRLIGDQRKLYQATNSDNYYFSDIEDKITFDDIKAKKTETKEIAYIRNMKGSKDQHSFTGMLKSNIPLLYSDFSISLMSVLFLEFNELIDFICNNVSRDIDNLDISPFSISDRSQSFKEISISKIENEIGVSLEKINSAIKILLNNECLRQVHFANTRSKFTDVEYLSETKVNIPSLYFSALYLKGLRLKEKNSSLDFSLTGFSVQNFTKKTFMAQCSTGTEKPIYGNPYIREEFINGEEKIKHTLTKASGQLEINLDIDLVKAKELKNIIEYAGVSSFYLGKKGLAYVSSISAR